MGSESWKMLPETSSEAVSQVQFQSKLPTAMQYPQSLEGQATPIPGDPPQSLQEAHIPNMNGQVDKLISGRHAEKIIDVEN